MLSQMMAYFSNVDRAVAAAHSGTIGTLAKLPRPRPYHSQNIILSRINRCNRYFGFALAIQQ
jgi:hypothetical protein